MIFSFLLPAWLCVRQGKHHDNAGGFPEVICGGCGAYDVDQRTAL